MRRGQRRRLSPVAAGIIAAAIVGALVYFGFTKSVPFRHHYEVTAVFRSANLVKSNSPVRIAGVNIGKVKSVELVHKGEPAARVTMRLDAKGLPLHDDAQFQVRPRIFLEGNFFVDVRPGSPSAPRVGDGHEFPINQTRTPVQLDQILASLPSATRTDLQRLLQELSKGFAGEGSRGYNRSIRYWESAYKNSAIVNDATLGTSEHDLSGYIASAGQVAEALDRNASQLKSLITDFNTTAHAFATRQNDLSATLAELPRTLGAARPAFAALNAAFPPTRRLVAALRPAVRSSGPTIDVSLPLVRQLRALVSKPELRGLSRDLRPTVPSLALLNRETVPLYEQVRAASSCQNEVILPWTHDTISDKQFPATGQVFEESTKSLPGLAGESRSGDANGQWFRVLLSAGSYASPAGAGKFMLTQQPVMGANPPKPAQRSPLRPNVPCETQQTPDLHTDPTQVASMRVNQTSPAALALQQKGIAEAAKWLQGQIKDEKLGSLLKVSTDPVTKAQLPKLRALGRAGR